MPFVLVMRKNDEMVAVRDEAEALMPLGDVVGVGVVEVVPAAEEEADVVGDERGLAGVLVQHLGSPGELRRSVSPRRARRWC